MRLRFASLRHTLLVRGALGTRSGRIGVIIVAIVVGIAVLGPTLAQTSPYDIAGVPYESPSSSHPLGTDGLGRDVLSRYLHGGRQILWAAFSSTLLAYVVGIGFGMAAGLRRGRGDLAAVWFADVLLAFPPIVFILVLLAATGPRLSMVVLGIALIQIPRIFRIVRATTAEVSTREYVEAATARGESTTSILRREILPNIWTPVLADFGVRLGGSIILVASLSYLGFGTAPPQADWGLMISEDRLGLTVQPWITIVPAATIAILAIGVNLFADSVARSAGRSVIGRGI